MTNKKTLPNAVLSLLCLFALIACSEKVSNSKKEMSTKEMEIFPRGEKLSNEWFSGTAFLQPLLSRDKNNDFALGSVTFEPKARTHWHTHPKGQVLIVTDGQGL